EEELCGPTDTTSPRGLGSRTGWAPSPLLVVATEFTTRRRRLKASAIPSPRTPSAKVFERLARLLHLRAGRMLTRTESALLQAAALPGDWAARPQLTLCRSACISPAFINTTRLLNGRLVGEAQSVSPIWAPRCMD